MLFGNLFHTGPVSQSFKSDLDDLDVGLVDPRNVSLVKPNVVDPDDRHACLVPIIAEKLVKLYCQSIAISCRSDSGGGNAELRRAEFRVAGGLSRKSGWASGETVAACTCRLQST